MKKYLIIMFVMCFAAATIVSCGGKSSTETEDSKKASTEEAHEEENTNTAMLTGSQMKSIGLKLGSIENKQLTTALKTNGTLQVPNQNRASVNSVYSGAIKSLLVQPGNLVRKGQTIATISNPEFIQVQSDYLNASAKISLVELEVKRQKELNAGNAGALKNLQSAETELKTLQTAKATYAQQIQLMGLNPGRLSKGRLISVLSVKSPINGVVSNVKVEMGSYVDVNTPIAEIVDNSQLHLDLFVYEKDIPKLKNNQLIHFTMTNNPGKEYDAQIYSLGSSFEGESKAVTVHAKVQGNKAGLIDGMTVTAVISLETGTKPAVPSEAIVNLGGQDFIFVRKVEAEHQKGNETTGHKDEKGMTFEKIPVAKGTTDVGYTEITLLKEIPKDAEIVVKGAFFVLAKMSNAGEHEH
ncbi:efflux RND transporter periplasmic adaptor subunit [Pedobacter punctiformis]|uniref:Efflux RND transporter periplasmic adaptor subunit n=1 Tax=Pedobacter punctiformis TaxID=3004097 RepID=A0ABT4L8D8_9SPHI|nr:efflux RND transporter periplasmic adaptor subunit [Pedobacter sp. HCMS5-2]MCZ4244091.1 efflux RND transporter periplasmic adaptor subunit [Pedobacter sp. HCMS5-2]